MAETTARSWLRCYRCWSQDLEVQVHYEGIHKIDPETGERAEVVLKQFEIDAIGIRVDSRRLIGEDDVDDSRPAAGPDGIRPARRGVLGAESRQEGPVSQRQEVDHGVRLLVMMCESIPGIRPISALVSYDSWADGV